MVESILTLLIAGILAGIIFSMPAAGPISILITSNALKGKLRFCVRTALGASIVEFFYIFIAVYGITALYSYYKSLIPYLLIIGSAIILLVSIRILKSRLDYLEAICQNLTGHAKLEHAVGKTLIAE